MLQGTKFKVEIHSKNRILSPPIKHTDKKKFQPHRV